MAATKEMVQELLRLAEQYQSSPAVANLLTMVAAAAQDDGGVDFHNYCLPYVAQQHLKASYAPAPLINLGDKITKLCAEAQVQDRYLGLLLMAVFGALVNQKTAELAHHCTQFVTAEMRTIDAPNN